MITSVLNTAVIIRNVAVFLTSEHSGVEHPGFDGKCTGLDNQWVPRYEISRLRMKKWGFLLTINTAVIYTVIVQ